MWIFEVEVWSYIYHLKGLEKLFNSVKKIFELAITAGVSAHQSLEMTVTHFYENGEKKFKIFQLKID